MPPHSALLCFTANYLVWPALLQVTTAERRSCGSGAAWRCLGLLGRLLEPHTLHVFYNLNQIFCQCNRDSAVLICTCMYVLHVCLSRERDPSSVALPEVSSSFLFFTHLKVLFFPSTWRVFPLLNWGSKDRECRSLFRLTQCDCEKWDYL